jgi:DNA-directed RNA polymerase specialized sigma24 family protein
MKAGDYTHIGEGGGRFPTTRWTLLTEIQRGNDTRSRRLIAQLVRDYWRPVYCYLRRKGYGNEDAKDLTQEFFQEVVLGRSLLQRANSSRGRFRTFLLTSLDRYLANVHRRRVARKRIPPDKLIPLGDADIGELPQVASDLTCEESFDYAWISGLLDRMLAEVQAECCHRGMKTHWNLFRDRVLQPILKDTQPPPLTQLCARYGIDQATKASNMIFAVKKRFRVALQRQVRQSVTDDTEMSEELTELAQFLARG